VSGGSNNYRVCIVGGGFGALLTHTTLRYLGFENEEILVLGDQEDPVATYRAFAWGLGQTVLRSESESHFLPADWPTFAMMDVFARRRLTAVGRSINRTFNPGVPDILAEARAVADQLGYRRSFRRCMVGDVVRAGSDRDPYFGIYDTDGNLEARARHVLLAVGHGPLFFPPLLDEARKNPAMKDRIVQAYESKRYAPGGRYIVVGSGIAGVNEWVNVLLSGAECIALRRTPTPDDQDLNVPRCLFEALGIDAFQELPHEARLKLLNKVLRGTTPQRRNWQELIAEGYEKGTFHEVIGEVVHVEPGPEGLVVDC
jgi:cation diffusion facilitator CzcD-associated flavoprotein CzcO